MTRNPYKKQDMCTQVTVGAMTYSDLTPPTEEEICEREKGLEGFAKARSGETTLMLKSVGKNRGNFGSHSKAKLGVRE